MIELLAAAALAPWAHSLVFGALPHWSTGASGTVNSFYDSANIQAEGVGGLDRNERPVTAIGLPRTRQTGHSLTCRAMR